MNEISDLAYEDYTKGMKYKEIAEKYNVSLNTVKSWKTRKWNKKSVHTNKEKVCTQKKKRGGQPGNKNATGPPKNKNAEIHGFFTKHLPEDTLDIMQEIQNQKPLDMLWDQIMIQYTAIIRSQKIMYVTDKDEMIKELKKKKESSNNYGDSTEIEYEFQFAWDRQATFLNAQSRAISELRNLIKSYLELEGAQKDKSNTGAQDWKTTIQEIAKRRRDKKHQEEVKPNE